MPADSSSSSSSSSKRSLPQVESLSSQASSTTSSARLPSTNAVTFSDSSAYDSDDDDSGSSTTGRGAASVTSSTSSGVVLCFDDGAIPLMDENDNDEKVLGVSRIGGRAFFPLEPQELPPPSVVLACPNCSSTLRLLVQIYAPLTAPLRPLSSPHPANKYRDEFDRLLYVFGCVRRGCTGVRCIRAARRNDGWAKEGSENRLKKRMEEEETRRVKEQQRSHNPFAAAAATAPATGGSSNGGLFGGPDENPFGAASNPFSSSSQNDFGTYIFGGSTDSSSGNSNSAPVKEDEESKGAGSETGGLPSAVPSESAAAPVENPVNTWPTPGTPYDSYSEVGPRYLATSYEELSPTHKNRSSASKQAAQLAKQLASTSLSVSEPREHHKGGRTGKTGPSSKPGATFTSSEEGAGWSAEAYEVMKLSGVEEVFLAFQDRLEASGAAEQVLRYEYGGQPLPFSSRSTPYSLLYKNASPAPGSLTTVTRTGHAGPGSNGNGNSDIGGAGRYDSSCSGVSRCQHCGSQRVFECQLMPNLVYLLEKALNKGGTSAQGQEGEMDSEGEKELGWATVWCFTCSSDCLDAQNGGDGDGQGEEDGERLDWVGWREEEAMVELED